jgi:alkylation response protein AidB-like acyl-CoA dehydrogenase
MDFHFTEEEEDFRQEVRQFLREELDPDWVAPSNFAIFGDDGLWAAAQKMAQKLSEKGWLTLGWPEAYGGKPGSQFKKLILFEEMAYHGAPGVDPFGVKMLAPILLAYGTEEQKRRHLPPIAQGKLMWCQGFSEPDAGSDLAALRTAAKETDDCFIVNGQKVWTSGGHRADWSFFLARTDPDAARHRGISFFLVDMKTPGITVSPLINILGEHCFNEIYFDDVRIPKENLVGEKNKGWYVAMSLEGFERSMIEYSAECRRYFERFVQFLKEADDHRKDLIKKSDIRRRLAKLAAMIEAARWLAYRVAWQQSKGGEVAYEAALSKVYGSELMQHMGQVCLDILGLYGQLIPGSKWAPLKGEIERWYVGNLGRTIGGGTSEIQRNLIATIGLKLPR